MIEFGKNEDNFRMTPNLPMDLDNLLQIYWMWSEKFNLLSMVMPKNLVELTKFNLLFLIRILLWPVKLSLENSYSIRRFGDIEGKFVCAQPGINFISFFIKKKHTVHL